MLTNFLIAYLCGSIPFGLILSNIFGHGNLRKLGSGNIGATNVLRTQGKLLGGLTLLLDVIKCVLPVLERKNTNFVYGIFAFAILGHMYPVWLKFRGGKGVASFLGGMLALSPSIGIFCLIAWLLVFHFFKISSIAGLTACLLGAIIFVIKLLYSDASNAMFSCACVSIIALLIVLRHKENIQRIIQKKELRISSKKE